MLVDKAFFLQLAEYLSHSLWLHPEPSDQITFG